MPSIRKYFLGINWLFVWWESEIMSKFHFVILLEFLADAKMHRFPPHRQCWWWLDVMVILMMAALRMQTIRFDRSIWKCIHHRESVSNQFVWIMMHGVIFLCWLLIEQYLDPFSIVSKLTSLKVFKWDEHFRFIQRLKLTTLSSSCNIDSKFQLMIRIRSVAVFGPFLNKRINLIKITNNEKNRI